MKRLVKALVITAMFAVPAFAAENPFQTSPELDAQIRAGLHHLYNLDFEEAEKTFLALKEHEEEHPMVAFGLTSVHWWRLSVYVLENDEKESAAFLASVENSIRLSKAKIAKGDPTGEGWMTLGGAEGLLGRWQAANRKWMPAYFKGKSAYKNLKNSIEANPGMYDAYMGLGIFDYYVATLPSFVRVLGFLGQGGDKQKGLDELETAGEKGTYAAIPAKLFLVNIYSSLENQPERALGVLGKLREEFPRSPFVHMLVVVNLYNHGTADELEAETDEFIRRVESKVYRKEFETQGWFGKGLVSFKLHNWVGAVADFDRAISVGTVKDPFFTWSYLYKGYALDVLKKREEAKTAYREVLSHIRRWGAHDNAQARLKRPFTEAEKEMTKLIL